MCARAVQAPGRKKLGPPLRGRGIFRDLAHHGPFFLQSELFVCVWFFLPHLRVYAVSISSSLHSRACKINKNTGAINMVFFQVKRKPGETRRPQGKRERREPRVADSIKGAKNTKAILSFFFRKRKGPYLFVRFAETVVGW